MHGRIGNWQKTESKPDVFSLEGLIQWLEKQPPNGAYCPYDPAFCMLGQYASAMGASNPEKTSMALADRKEFERAAYYPEGDDPTESTFGAALARARAAQT